MSCFAPLPAIRSICDPKKVIVGKRSMPGSFAPTLIKSTGELIEPFRIPCGRCLGCQIDRSTLWASRLVCELLEHPPGTCFFLTLTYDDDHLPKVILPDGLTKAATLRPDDMTAFLKRWRSRDTDHRLRFFYSGEYGPRTYRPHYHMISFGMPVNDLRVYTRNTRGDVYFTSEYINSLWHYQGRVLVSDVTWESCAYVARYAVKKLGPKPDMTRMGLYPEFIRMSRRPGIGGDFFEKHSNRFLQGDSIPLPSLPDQARPHSAQAPRFFMDKLAEIDPSAVAKVKAIRRECREAVNRLHQFSSHLDEDSYLQSQAFDLAEKLKVLKRQSI